MKELGKWQVISFISRTSAMAIGLIQSFVIIRLLTVSEWGVIQLAISIGGALGVYQHLGLASASTREIASAKNDTDIFKIFLTSTLIRYAITIPLAIGLYFYSDKLAVGLYKNPLLIAPLKIYAISLMFIGVQSILNSVISGTKRFKSLFIYQVVVSILNIAIFIPFIVMYKINGYFWAYLIFNILNTFILTIIAFKPLKGKIKLPSKKDFKILFKEIFSISMAIYFVKILATNWEKLGPNLLGIYLSPEAIAFFSFAILYAKKILSISDSVTDVNLPVLSEKFATDLNDFKHSFKLNFDKVFAFIILVSGTACYWAPQVIKILVGGDKYAQSYQYIPFVLLAFVLYSIADVTKSSVYVPAKLIKEMAFSYVILILLSILGYYSGLRYFDGLESMSLALAFGAIVSNVYVFYSIKRALNFTFFTYKHWLILFQSFVIGWTGLTLGFVTKAMIYPVFLGLMIWALFISNMITRQEIINLGKLWKFKK